MNVLFVAGFSPIVADPVGASTFYREDLGLPLDTVAGDYIAVDNWGDSRHLGIWLGDRRRRGGGRVGRRAGLGGDRGVGVGWAGGGAPPPAKGVAQMEGHGSRSGSLAGLLDDRAVRGDAGARGPSKHGGNLVEVAGVCGRGRRRTKG